MRSSPVIPSTANSGSTARAAIQQLERAYARRPDPERHELRPIGTDGRAAAVA